MSHPSKIFVMDIQPQQEVAAHFLLAEKQLRTARNGTLFLTLKLLDKSGEITGRVWENAEATAALLTVNQPVFARGRSETFRDELQLQIQEIYPVPVREITPADFLPVCPLDREELFERFKKLVASIQRPSLNQLMRSFLKDARLMEQFRQAPAAKSMHHAYLGGLLEHTFSVATLASNLCTHYPFLDRDLLLTGAVLHDVGKVEEFAYDLIIDYSSTGRLLGHMILGVQILEEKLRQVKHVPEEEAMLLKHFILSHHGETERGAVRLPMTREAFALHFADDFDAKMNSLNRILSESKDPDSAWTAYQPLFQRFFFRGSPETEDATPSSSPEASSRKQSGVQLSIWATARNRS